MRTEQEVHSFRVVSYSPRRATTTTSSCAKNRTLKAFSSEAYAASTRSKQSQKNASRLSKLGYAAFLLLLPSTRRASNMCDGVTSVPSSLFVTMRGRKEGRGRR